MRFSKEHCWIEKKENGVLIGITDFAASKICENFELFLCDEDDYIHSGESIGEIISASNRATGRFKGKGYKANFT